MSKKVTPLIEYVAESTAACMVTMLQGNLLAITVGHLLIAFQTGLVAGSIAAVSIFFTHTKQRWLISVLLGVATGIVDFFVHPGMFGTIATEAVVTGFGAAMLSYLAGTAVRHFRNRRRVAA